MTYHAFPTGIAGSHYAIVQGEGDDAPTIAHVDDKADATRLLEALNGGTVPKLEPRRTTIGPHRYTVTPFVDVAAIERSISLLDDTLGSGLVSAADRVRIVERNTSLVIEEEY